MSLADRSNSESEPATSTELLLGRTVESLLVDLPPTEALALRLGGIVHRLTPALLQQLLIATDSKTEQVAALDLNDIWEQAELFRFADRDDEGALVYRPRVRSYLLSWWQTTQPELYKTANQSALHYFRSTQGQSELPFDSLLSPDIVYHWLIVDEVAARQYLAEQFEDACDRHQHTLAEHLLQYANERFEALTEQSQQWLRYYQARVALLHNQISQANLILNSLVQNESTPEVSAVAQWNLGQQLIHQQQWSGAIHSYKKSLSLLTSKQVGFYRVRLLMAIGDAYADLVLATGGLDLIHEPPQRLLRRIRIFLQFLPFSLYKWLVHAIDLLPNWYFGGNYQNWLAADLLLQAATWYRKAVSEANKTISPFNLVEAQINLASIEHQLGRWLRSQRHFSRLVKTEEILQSRFRWARLQQNRGWAWLSEHRYEKAEEALHEASDVFELFSELRLLAFSKRLLGRLYAVRGNWQQSMAAFTQSIRNYHVLGDSRNATQSFVDVGQWLTGDIQFSKLDEQLSAIRSELEELSYICRFPDRFLRLFRRLALFVAIPTTYLLAFPVIFATGVGPVLLVEMMIRIAIIPGALSALFARSSVFVLIILLIPLFLLWLYHFMYSFLGFMVVRLLGRNIASIEKEQPNQFIVTAGYLIHRKSNHHQNAQQHSLAVKWTEISHFIEIEYRWRTQVIDLISRIVLVDHSGQQMIIDAVTTNYGHLRREIGKHTAESGSNQIIKANLGLNILQTNWIILTGLAALAAFALLTWQGIEQGIYQGPNVNGSTNQGPIWLATASWQFWGTWLLFLVNLTLWRLLSRRINQPKGISIPPLISTRLLWVITISHLVFSIFLIIQAF